MIKRFTCKNCKSKNCPIFMPSAFEQENFGVNGDMITSTIYAVIDTVGCKYEERK